MNTTTSPYLMPEPPTSTGRALLARAFEHWCVLHHGYSPAEIADALDDAGTADRSIRHNVRVAARLLGELIASSRIPTFARPFGGGTPVPIPAGDWELDDFTARFARSAFDPRNPFSSQHQPTHWIFVELDSFNELVEQSCADQRPVERAARIVRQVAAPDVHVADTGSADDHVRLPEVMRRTGMSRSTIYRRIEQGRFPAQIEMDGNIASWREGEVAAWLADPK